jgi:methylenetetrahydrofolate reductase (NADPH)
MSIRKKLAAGEFLTLVELEPPKGINVAPFLESASRVKGRADAFVVPEMANAVMKISSLGGCMLLKSKGMEPVLQCCCRDRNRLALQADILAASALGIETVMAVEGEAPSFGDHHKARPVYDLELTDLLDVITKLTTGRDMAGIELDGTPEFTMGSFISPAVIGTVQQELEALEARNRAGAEFFITPPVFDLDSFKGFMKHLDGKPVKIIPNVLLLKSVGMARAIDLHMNHVHMPADMIARLKKAPDRVRECVQIARELITAVKEAGYAGVMVSPLGWEDRLPQILEGV